MAKLPLAFAPRSAPVAPVSIAVAPRGATLAPVDLTPALDLSGKPRITFLIGRGGAGKTTLARWLVERAQEAGRQAVLAALDPVNRTLANYFDGVAQPETSDPAAAARFLRDVLSFAMSGKHSAVIDLGGGDTTLSALLGDMPDLAGDMEAAGIAPIAYYLLAPRIDDLAPFLSLGFQPPATAFVCNLGLVDAGAGAAQFRTLTEQPAIRDAIASGARLLWMPRLDSDVVGQIEAARLSFGAASRKLGPFAGAQVRQWQRSMETAFEGVSTWLV